ncbi:hypothetical protein [Curvivirga aplysinae]|uniref:hypothetical protein n=1 Tax=Curvivirga aplysinae TaxID=2529852 RepID=UPI0012BC19DC|nr:hypothetical protein [Curvivirga aplysinae]MTI08528.1 hypothetical protein [Curvivirga aplysinae]
MKKVFLILVLLTFTACAQVSYVEPTEGPVGKVRFVTNVDSGITLIKQYSDAQCNNASEMFRLRNEYLMNSQEKSLGMPLNTYRKEANAEVLIPANDQQHFFFHMTTFLSGYTLECGVYVSHKFIEDKSYELYAHKVWKTLAAEELLDTPIDDLLESCVVDLVEIVGEGDDAQKVPIKTYNNQLSNMSHGCAKEINQLY